MLPEPCVLRGTIQGKDMIADFCIARCSMSTGPYLVVSFPSSSDSWDTTWPIPCSNTPHEPSPIVALLTVQKPVVMHAPAQSMEIPKFGLETHAKKSEHQQYLLLLVDNLDLKVSLGLIHYLVMNDHVCCFGPKSLKISKIRKLSGCVNFVQGVEFAP